MQRLMLRRTRITTTSMNTVTGMNMDMNMDMHRIPIMHTTTIMTNTVPMRTRARPAAHMTMVTGRTLIRRTLIHITMRITTNSPARTPHRRFLPP